MEDATSQEGNSSRFAKYRKKRFLLLLLPLLLIIILTVFIGLRIIQHQNQVKLAKRGVFINKSLENKPLLNVEKEINTPMLLPYVPNFKKLRLSYNLPVGDGTLIPYKNHFITWWGYQILEIDAKTHKYIREAIMPCSVDDLIVHESTLFVLCKDRLPIEKNSIFYTDVSSIYTIDLKSGLLKRHYSHAFGEMRFSDVPSTINSNPKFVDYPIISNLNFTYKDDNLWLGVENGLVKISTNSEEITFYNLDAFTCKYTCLKFEEYSSVDGEFLIYSNKSAVWTYTVTSDGKIILYVYNDKKNSWDSYSSESVENSIPIPGWASMFEDNNKIYFYYTILKKNTDTNSSSDTLYRIIVFNTITKKWSHVTDTNNMSNAQKKYFPGVEYEYGVTPTNFGPNFGIISNKVNNKYYLTGSDGIYVLKEHTFPKKIVSFNFNLNDLETMYVNQDETSIFIVGRKGALEDRPKTIGEQLAILRVDLKNKKITDIMKNSSLLSRQSLSSKYPDSLQQLMDLFASNIRLTPAKNGIMIIGNINLTGSSDMRQLGVIDLQTDTFKLFYSCTSHPSSPLENCLPKSNF